MKEETGSEDQIDSNHGIMFRSQHSARLQKFRYFYQYPYFRMFVAYFVTLCNFLIYAEDPVAHSLSKCEIPVVGNVIAMLLARYPPNGFSALKVLLWLMAVTVGIIVGKLAIHYRLLRKTFRLQMFAHDQGSWMICFLTSILMIFITSFIYNGFLSLDSSMGSYKITSYIGATNHIFMRTAALGTWFGDFMTAWMVTDMMLQERSKYDKWLPTMRKWWVHGYRRVILFWVFTITLTTIVIAAICTHFINWDRLNGDVAYTNELGRAFLASFILVMDFTIVMQDWDFPLFESELDVKLPGVNTSHIKFKIPSWLRRDYVIHVTGKWFQYGILFIVLLLDVNMWKNQIFYSPLAYGQYTGEDGHIFSVRDRFSLDNYGNATIYSYDWRKININADTNRTFMADDYRTNSRYRGYSLGVKLIAFVPSLVTFIVFGTLIYLFGRTDIAQNITRESTSITNIEIRKSNPQRKGSKERIAENEDSPNEPLTNSEDEKPKNSQRKGSKAKMINEENPPNSYGSVNEIENPAIDT